MFTSAARRPRLLYALGALALALPWLVYPSLFAADEYVHVYNAEVLRAMLADAGSRYHDWFEINRFPEPNWFGHAWLLAVGALSPSWFAEKGFVALVALANGYAFLGTRGSGFSVSSPLTGETRAEPTQDTLFAPLAALLALVFWLSAVWQFGFVNYLLGMAFCFAGLRHTAGREANLPYFAWAVLLYFCHPIALLLFLGVVTLRSMVVRGSITDRLSPKPGDWGALLTDTLLRFGLPLALFVAYVLRNTEVSTLSGASPYRLLEMLLYHRRLILFDEAGESPIAKVIMLLTLAALLLGARHFARRWDARRLVGAALLAVLLGSILLVPDYLVGGAIIHQRLMPVAFVAALWVGVAVRDRVDVEQRTVVPSRIALTVLLLAVFSLSAKRVLALRPVAAVYAGLEDFAQSIPEGAVVLPANGFVAGLTGGDSLARSPVFHHFAAHVGARRSLVLLDNYEAFVGYFPLRWREGRSPFAACGRGIEAHPLSLPRECADYITQEAEYVLVLGTLEGALDASTYEWLVPRLREAARTNDFALYEVR